MKAKLPLLKKYIDKQADDPHIWFEASFMTEQILQREIRRIAWLIEDATAEQIQRVVDWMRQQDGR